jgi:hypothetical protein
MNPLIHLVRFGSSYSYHPSYSDHPSFGYHPSYASYGYHHALGGGWIAHMILSSMIHAMIYSVIFRLLGHLSLGEDICLVVAVIALIYSWNRNRSYRRW